MAEERSRITIKESENGQIQVADEVIAVIAGLAATEIEGVSSMSGNITYDIVSKLGSKGLSKGVRVDVNDGVVKVALSINIAYGYSIPEVSAKVQNRVKTEIGNMTGLTVSAVNVRIADVDTHAVE